MREGRGVCGSYSCSLELRIVVEKVVAVDEEAGDYGKVPEHHKKKKTVSHSLRTLALTS